MQLQFASEELKLLVDILNATEEPSAEDLLDRVLRRDLRFGFDELETLAGILGARNRALREEVQRAENTDLKRNLQRKQKLLQHMVDKVTEACAMA